ncbi:MAG: flagellar protein export ATPase FliI [Gammaproteobacteria bacterium]|nr:MAG: flagellar protein export ATPase FliI [Gammaproteobacteria bacterium]
MQMSNANQINWSEKLLQKSSQLQKPQFSVDGVLKRMVGLTLEAEGCQAPVGARCNIISSNGIEIEGEVVGFAGDKLYLMPTGDIQGLMPNAIVRTSNNVCQAKVGPKLLGRIIDGGGQPLDGKGNIEWEAQVPLTGKVINPLHREPIREPLDVGVRAINSILTVGRGQRMGLFAGSGVGKSVLLGMMTKYTSADIVVVGLIGERGREVKEFIEQILGAAGLARSVVIAAPADASPLMRLHGAMQATSIAEYFRDQGKNVLLLMDSLTRYAQAQREIGLAIGEPPTTKGYPPSVFAKLPTLVERAGNGKIGGGSITAFYTVLVEGDDQNDPIADAARAILDGHIVLTRQLADSGHYPAIDIEQSVSRVMTSILKPEHIKKVQRFKSLSSIYRQNQDLIGVGAYQPGTDSNIDEAINYYPQLMHFLRQDINEKVGLQQATAELFNLVPEQNHEMVSASQEPSAK